MTLTSEDAKNEELEDLNFFSVVERLKYQGALGSHTFLKEIPYFNITTPSKQSQVKQLFQDLLNPHFYVFIKKNISSIMNSLDLNLQPQQVMDFSQIVLYKVLPCQDQNCSKKPREIATHNQYKDFEYECPFYHHARDQRRMVISAEIGDEFTYKANYFEEGKSNTQKEKYSQNYFESMFHPLYYKMFRCKREFCETSTCCPFYHNEEEKKLWDATFAGFVKKDRITYVKDKNKYFENPFQKKGIKSEKENSGNNNSKKSKLHSKKSNSSRNGKFNSDELQETTLPQKLSIC